MNAAQHITIFSLRLYRWLISPAKTLIFGPFGHCRFTPSCSAYALGCVVKHGALAGSWLAVKRICRCHPWGGCGDDPVPESLKSQRSATAASPGPAGTSKAGTSIAVAGDLRNQQAF